MGVLTDVGHAATGVASGVAQGVVNGVAGLWNMAFRDDVVFGGMKEGAESLVNSAEKVANHAVDSLAAQMGTFIPPPAFKDSKSSGPSTPAIG